MTRATRLLVLAALAPPLYHGAIRGLLRWNFARVRKGDTRVLFATYAADVHFRFPGSSSWAADIHSKQELQRWVRRFVDVGLQLYPDRIVVDGPPWRTRICVLCHDSFTALDGERIYENRGVITGTIAWGKLVEYEVHEDTEKVAAFDEYLTERGA
jgi:ketosteroid isomerase-like protein